MNLGTFAVVIADGPRAHAPAEIDSYSGLGQTAPGLAVAMGSYVHAVARRHAAARGWFAKFVMFHAVFAAHADRDRARRDRLGRT